MASQAWTASPERPQSTRPGSANFGRARGSSVDQLADETDSAGMPRSDLPLSDMPLSELKAQMETAMSHFDAIAAGPTKQRPMSGESASTASAWPELGGHRLEGETYSSTGRPAPVQVRDAAPVDPYEPQYEPLDLHSDLAAELRLQGGVVGRDSPKREKVHLGPYLRCNFNVPPVEQLVFVPHKLRQPQERPSSARPRMHAVPPNSPRCRAASAAPRSRVGRPGARPGGVSLATAAHAVAAVTGKADGELAAQQKAGHGVLGLHQRSLCAAALLYPYPYPYLHPYP